MNRMSAHRNEMKLCNAKLQYSWRPASPLAKLFSQAAMICLIELVMPVGKLERLRQSNAATGRAHGSLLLRSWILPGSCIFFVLTNKQLGHADGVVAILHDLLQLLFIQQITCR